MSTRRLTRDEITQLAHKFPDASRDLHDKLAAVQLSEEDIRRCLTATRFPADLLKSGGGRHLCE